MPADPEQDSSTKALELQKMIKTWFITGKFSGKAAQGKAQEPPEFWEEIPPGTHRAHPQRAAQSMTLFQVLFPKTFVKLQLMKNSDLGLDPAP